MSVNATPACLDVGTHLSKDTDSVLGLKRSDYHTSWQCVHNTDNTPCVQRHALSEQQVHAQPLSQGGFHHRIGELGSGAVDEPDRKLSSILDYLDSVSHQVLRIPESELGVLPGTSTCV